ncbi:MAG: 50S ribosomal protein L29 [Acholeplasmatales bacterium]|jgi:large subunit ribosomal protein L29|nr:50S ribosomal protein L29 [Acholeplasmatales bacterium]
MKSTSNLKEYRKLSVEQLTKRAEELKKDLFNLRFQNATGNLESTAKIPQTRKMIAQILTIITEKKDKGE